MKKLLWIITLLAILALWLLLSRTVDVNALFDKEVTIEDPCLDVEVTMDNSVREINEAIWACQVKLEQTWLDFDNLAKQRDNELEAMKEKNDARRAELERWKTELLGG